MKKDNKMTRKEMFDILDKFKNYVGLGDYNIFLTEDKVTPGHIAEAKIDDLEKELFIVIGPDFIPLSTEKKKNTLIHELIHARYQLFRIKVDKIEEYEEEQLVNDLTRGIELIR